MKDVGLLVIETEHMALERRRNEMAKFKLYPKDGFWYLGIEFNGKVILLMKKGRIGDCIQP